MSKEYIFDKISELKEKFKNFFQHRKKITALENYAVTGNFQHKNYLTLVKTCINEGFLGVEESVFLDHMLNKYEVNYLDWAHKTKWLKNHILEKQRAFPRKPVPVQSFFDFERKHTPVHIPLELLAGMGKVPAMGKRI